MERFRSWLFSPGDVVERALKALAMPADQVIWDLEDGVAAENTVKARKNIVGLLAGLGPSDRRPWVRINAPSTPEGREDLGVLLDVVPPGKRRILIPKAEADDFEVPYGAKGDEFVLIVETAKGFFDVRRGLPQGGGASRRLAFGALDYQLDLGGDTGPDEAELLIPRTELALASRIAGWEPPIDAVFPDIADIDALRASAERAKRFGFAGKLLIHPTHIGPVNEVFTPSAKERRWAEELLAAIRGQPGSIRWNNTMVDRPVMEHARRVVAYFEDEAGRDHDA